MTEAVSPRVIEFATHPDQYHHWKLAFDGPVATLAMDVQEDAGLSSEYKLKLNSYDLAVDIELADAVQRIRFEHPEVHAVVVTSLKDRIFCAGANIFMLGRSPHGFKVNFCKFTNETRLAIEDASEHSGIKFLAAVNGICAGGGYELALACDEILLVDDGSSAVSLPEAPLLGVLPGTGGLTRIVDKRKVRRDLADFFSTLTEGVRGKRAVEWRLVDAVCPRSRFQEAVAERAGGARRRVGSADVRPGRRVGTCPLHAHRRSRRGQFQGVVATRPHWCESSSSLKASEGVLQRRVFRGRRLSVAATAAMSRALCRLRSVPLGKYWRSRPLVFSFVPRCHGLRGSQKNTCSPVSIRSWACWAISAPWSQVRDRRS